MLTHQSLRSALRGVAILLCGAVPGMTGCGNFFIPVCQAYNTCTTTGTTATTPTTSTPTGTSPAASRTTSFSGAGSVVYVGNPVASSVQAFALQSGGPVNLAPSGYQLPSPPSAVAAAPSGRFLYAATSSGPLDIYRIAANGTLQAAGTANPVAVVTRPTSMAIDPSGRWLLVASARTRQLSEFEIDPATGGLSAATGSNARLDSGNLAQIYVTPNNQDVFVALGAGGVDEFTFNPASGGLSNPQHTAPLAAGKSDTAVVSNSSSTLLFVGEAGSGVRVFNVATGGTLTGVQGSPFASGQSEFAAMQVDPSNHFLYAADGTSNAIFRYAIGSTGALTALASAPLQSVSAPAALLVNSSGKYLISIPNATDSVPQLFSMAAAAGGH